MYSILLRKLIATVHCFVLLNTMLLYCTDNRKITHLLLPHGKTLQDTFKIKHCEALVFGSLQGNEVTQQMGQRSNTLH